MPMEKEIRTRIVGIVNLTPDSFSDGGKYNAVDAALAHMQQLVDDGADILDLGAESTRPNAATVAPDEEWQRMKDVLAEAKARFAHTLISIDTRNPTTAAKALEAGSDWINDVDGGKNPEMLAVLREADCPYVVMHSLTVPADPAVVLPDGLDATVTIHSWAERRMQELFDAGIATERLILDPGIGFGKTAAQSWNLLRGMPILMDLPVPMLVGHSRKSFFRLVGEQTAAERDMETHMVTCWLAQCGVPYIRVHDVAGTVRALKVGAQLRKEEQR